MEIPYIEYFGLREKPFGITPDPSFFFESATHREALDHLGFFIDLKEGFALISGDVGTGKTMLSRIFLASLGADKYHTALILNPIMTDEEFLREVITEFGIECPTATKKGMLDALEEFLITEFAGGKKCVIVVDEAQLLSKEVLEFIRILSNLETDKEKILHIILFAQLELTERLKEEYLKYLTQRITVMYILKPLTVEEVGPYIAYRLVKAGSKGSPSFLPEAVRRIFIASKGYPRLVNIIADRCLLALYARSGTAVDEKVVEEALKEQNIAVLASLHAESTVQGLKVRSPLVFVAGGLWVLFVVILLALAGMIPPLGNLLWKTDSPGLPPAKTTVQSEQTKAAAGGPLPKGEGAARAGVSQEAQKASPEAAVPSPFAAAPRGEGMLIYEVEIARLSAFTAGDGRLNLVKAFPCMLNAAGQKVFDSRKMADRESIYFTRRHVSAGRAGQKPAEAFVFTYPASPLLLQATKDERNGGGPTLSVDEATMKDLWSLVKPEGTALIITRRIRTVDGGNQRAAAAQVTDFLNEWRQSWETLDVKKHLSLYGPEFVKDGTGWNTFSARKQKVMADRTFVRVSLENPAIFVFDDGKERTAVVRVLQRYLSDNYADESLKVLRLRFHEGRWFLVGEETLAPGGRPTRTAVTRTTSPPQRSSTEQ
jgi:general secretion pathway protein A